MAILMALEITQLPFCSFLFIKVVTKSQLGSKDGDIDSTSR